MNSQRLLIVSASLETAEQLNQAIWIAGLKNEAEVWNEFPSASEMRRRLKESQDPYAAAIFDMSREHEALRLVSAMREASPQTVGIVVNGARRLASVVRAKQAGAWGYLTQPYDLQALAERLGVERTIAAERTNSGRLIAFIPAQGGAGASTVALNTAIAMSERLQGHTLLADYGFHCGAFAFNLKLEPQHTLADALRYDYRNSEWTTTATRWQQLDVLVGPREPSDVGPQDLARAPSLFEAAAAHYHCTVVDLPAPLLRSSAEVLDLADQVYVVCTPEITSLHLAKRLIERIRKLGRPGEKVRLLVNRVGSWGALETEQIRRVVGSEVEWALDNDYAAVRQAAWSGGPISASSALRAQIDQLADQVIREFKLPALKEEELFASA
jgi:pilus assembly protein CpaE